MNFICYDFVNHTKSLGCFCYQGSNHLHHYSEKNKRQHKKLGILQRQATKLKAVLFPTLEKIDEKKASAQMLPDQVLKIQKTTTLTKRCWILTKQLDIMIQNLKVTFQHSTQTIPVIVNFLWTCFKTIKKTIKFKCYFLSVHANDLHWFIK